MLAAFCLASATVLLAQTENLHDRILRAVEPASSQKAEALLKEKRYADVETLLTGQPAETDALRGALEFLSGNMAAAANYFQQAAALGSLRESDRFTLAMAWVRLNRDADSRRELAQLAADHPDKALYPYWLGRLDYDQRRYTEAVEHLKRATALDGKSARAWDSLGLAYDMQGNADQALSAFQEGARVNREQTPASPWPPHDLGVLLLRMGDAKAAETALREALQYDSRMQPAHYHLGRALEKQEANNEAITEYLAAMKLDEKAADVCYSLAMLYRKMHREPEADAMFAEWRRRRDAAQR